MKKKNDDESPFNAAPREAPSNFNLVSMVRKEFAFSLSILLQIPFLRSRVGLNRDSQTIR